MIPLAHLVTRFLLFTVYYSRRLASLFPLDAREQRLIVRSDLAVMTVERDVSPDRRQAPFNTTSILHTDRKPLLTVLTASAPTLKIVGPHSADHSTPPSSASAMATVSSATLTFPSDLTVDDGASWNLVPYDIPWGSDYYQYKDGTLPGPDGSCLFLRSPTPVEKRRTLQACKMCRERKAKVSAVF